MPTGRCIKDELPVWGVDQQGRMPVGDILKGAHSDCEYRPLTRIKDFAALAISIRERCAQEFNFFADHFLLIKCAVFSNGCANVALIHRFSPLKQQSALAQAADRSEVMRDKYQGRSIFR